MADALDSKSSTLTGVEVQVLSPVLLNLKRLTIDRASVSSARLNLWLGRFWEAEGNCRAIVLAWRLDSSL